MHSVCQKFCSIFAVCVVKFLNKNFITWLYRALLDGFGSGSDRIIFVMQY